MLSIIESCVDVTELNLDSSHNYLESHYQNALLHYLRESHDLKKHTIHKEVMINYRLSDGFIFGYGRADIMIETDEECHILELKSGVALSPKCFGKYFAQCRRYVAHHETTKKKSGYVVIFNSGCSAITKVLD